MLPAALSHTPAGPPPTWKQRKLGGNGPGTSSAKSIRTGTLASRTNTAPPASWRAAVGFERSIVVYARRPSIVAIEHALGPSGEKGGALGRGDWARAQMPYCAPCWSVATPLQLAHAEPELTFGWLTVGELRRVLFS